jgi:hypothetical protein
VTRHLGSHECTAFSCFQGICAGLRYADIHAVFDADAIHPATEVECSRVSVLYFRDTFYCLQANDNLNQLPHAIQPHTYRVDVVLHPD